MKLSILPIYVIIVFGFSIYITYRAKKTQALSSRETLSISLLLLALLLWTGIAIVMGASGIHQKLASQFPFLWQPFIPIVITAAALIFSRSLRSGLRGLVSATPWHWLIFFQALRIGAIGGVIKGLKGEITSSFVFWVGIPDCLFGLSALFVGWLFLRRGVTTSFLMFWNLLGAAVILLPLSALMTTFMKETGFYFIFEFPMVLAPSIVVPILVLFNLLHAWGNYNETWRTH